MKSNKNYIFIALAVVVGAAAVYFSLRSTGNEAATAPPATEAAPMASPDSPYMTLSDLKGNAVAMDTSKLVFVNLWATWCGPCNAEMPSIESLYERYKNNPKMAFYVVSDEDASTVLPFLERKDYDLPFYLYNGAYPAAMSGNAIPRTYMVRNGKVLVEQVGSMNWNDPQVISFIDQQLAM